MRPRLVASSCKATSSLLVLAVLLLCAVAHAQKAPATARSFDWTFNKGETLVYDFDQHVDVKINDGTTQSKPPLDISGTIEVLPKDAQAARMMLQASKKGGAPTPVASTIPPAKPAPVADSGSSCSCRRAAPSTATPPVAPPPTREHRVTALFNLAKNGSIEGSRATAGGQTELMVRLLMPLPLKPLTPGQTEQAEVHVDGVGGRFPMSGTQVITYKEDRVVDGRTLSVLTSKVEMKGSADPAVEKHRGHASQMKGSMQLNAQGELLFDVVSGRLFRAKSDLSFQLNTSRVVGGVKRPVSLVQKATTKLAFARVKAAARRVNAPSSRPSSLPASAPAASPRAPSDHDGVKGDKS